MRSLFTTFFLLTVCGVFSQNLSLEYSSGDFWVSDSGKWSVVEEGGVLSKDSQVRLSPGSSAVIKAGTFKLYLNNPGTSLRAFSLEKVLAEWKKAATGQNLVAEKMGKLIGIPSKTKEGAANLGARGEDQGQLGTNQPKVADDLWDRIQADLQAGDQRSSLPLLKELLDYAEGERLSETAVLLAQQYWVLQDWDDLQAWAEDAVVSVPTLTGEQKQLLLYLESLGLMARDENAQPLWDRLIALAPHSELAESLIPPSN